MTEREKWRTLAQILAVTVPLGALIGLGLGWIIGAGGASLAAGAVIGLFVTAGFVTFDASWALGLIPRGWRESPFLVVLLTRSLVWLAIIIVGLSVPLLTVGGLSTADLIDQTFRTAVVACFVAALLFNFVAQVNRLMGRRVLVRLILGRYHRPREEHRVFLLIDLRGSTQIAEQLGNLRYHAFLKRFISDVTGSVVRYRGEVHRYVGDEVILTWTAEEGLRDARCVRAVFAISDTLESERSGYEADFGVVPSFWAGLHLGPVVAGEIGTFKQEIAFLGDTLNVAARIEQACRELQQPFLASAAVISRLALPSEIASESLGGTELRGVDGSVQLLAMTRVAGQPTTV
jgi:adenylate cyclase